MAHSSQKSLLVQEAPFSGDGKFPNRRLRLSCHSQVMARWTWESHFLSLGLQSITASVNGSSNSLDCFENPCGNLYREGFAHRKTIYGYWAPQRQDLSGSSLTKSPWLTSKTDTMLYTKFHFIAHRVRVLSLSTLKSHLPLLAYFNENLFG